MIPALVPSSGNKINKLERTLAAGAEYTFRADCHFVYFVEATFGVEIQFDNGPFVPMNLALGYRVAEGDVITSITMRNTLSEPMSFLLFFGRGYIIDQRLNVLESRNGSAASLVPNGARTVAAEIVVGNNGGEYIIQANPNRKKLVFNINAFDSQIYDEDSIQFLDSMRNPIYSVNFTAQIPLFQFYDNIPIYINPDFANTGLAIPCSFDDYSGSLTVVNNTAGILIASVYEIVYK